MPYSCWLVALFLVLSTLVVPPTAAQPDSPSHERAEQSARAAAQSWLRVVDDGEFEESWEAAASAFQERVPQETWEDRGDQLRDSIQTGASRTLTMVQYRNSLRQTSGGPFVILKYRSTPGDLSIEEVVLTTRIDDTWKVTGYQVTPLRRTPVRTIRPSREN